MNLYPNKPQSFLSNIKKKNVSELPSFSIITPSLNQGKYLEETIQSVLQQNYPNLEYIIIDGGSTDETVDIIKKYSQSINYWVSESDHGQSHAINKGLSLVSGEWVAWLNADDYYKDKAIWQIASVIQKIKDCQWIVGSVECGNDELGWDRVFSPRCNTDQWLDFVCPKFPKGTSLPQPASFWSTQALYTTGYLNEKLHFAMDYEYWGRLARNGYRPICLDTKICRFRIHSQSKTSRGKKPFFEEELLVVDKLLSQEKGKSFLKLLLYKTFFKAYFIRTPGKIKTFVKVIIFALLKRYYRLQ